MAFTPTLRLTKGSKLTWEEMDGNFQGLADAIASSGGGGGEVVYSSFAAMVAADNSAYNKVSTKHYYADWETNPTYPTGAATYIKTGIIGTPAETDGGSYFHDTGGNKWVLLHGDGVLISQFGAKPANETFDNRAAIQACIDYCTTRGVNLVIDPVEQTWDETLNGGSGAYVNRYFGIGSFHPLFVDGYCLYIGEPRNFFILGNTSRVTSIRYYGTTAGKCLLRLGATYGSDWGYVVDGLGLSCTADETDQAGCVLDHAVYARNNGSLARCSFSNSTFIGGLLTCFEFHGYMSDFRQIELRYGQQGGIKFDGPDNQPTGSDPITTSITLQNVWSRFCGGTGIYFRNQAWYINLISCGVDGAGAGFATPTNRPEYAYQFGNVRGLSVNGCGCEEVDRVMKMVSADSIIIDGMKGTGWGKTDGTVADYAIEITGNGTNVNISGWPKGVAVTTGTAPTKKYNYVLGLTKSDNAMGNLLVQIMDNGINYLETFHVANTGTYTIPIVWPNSTADGNHRAQTKTGNVTWPNAGVRIAPSAGQFGLGGGVKRIIFIGGEDVSSLHQLFQHFGGNVRTTYAIRVTLNSQSGTTAAMWDGVANVTTGGKNITYFTKTSGNSGALPTIAWNGDVLEYNANTNLFDSIIEITAYSEITTSSVEFLK